MNITVGLRALTLLAFVAGATALIVGSSGAIVGAALAIGHP